MGNASKSTTYPATQSGEPHARVSDARRSRTHYSSCTPCRRARLKHGSPSTHPPRGPELRSLRAWKREQHDATQYIFTSLRGSPMTRRTVHHVVAEAPKAADIEFRFTLMLRHATGYYLANAGQDTRAIQLYFGHKNIRTPSDTRNWRPAGSRPSGRISG